MVFEFRVLGILLTFLLIFYSTLKKRKGNSRFGIVLFGTYVLEFLYAFACVFDGGEAISKIYSIAYCVVFSFYLYYFLVHFVSSKYGSEFKRKMGLFNGLFLGIDLLIIVIIIFCHDIFRLQNIILIFSLLVSVINLVLLFMSKRYTNDKKFLPLFGFVLLAFVFLILSVPFDKMEIMESSVVILTTYLYLFFEVDSNDEIETLKLERDYAMKNLLDKEMFLKKLSHEIRVPISTIDGFSQLMLDSKSVIEMKEEANDMIIASQELIDIINGMIDLSMIESGNLEIIKESYNIYDIIGDLCKMLSSRIKGNDVKFKYEIAKNIPEVLLGDSDRIRQILVNIISNSIKYTEKGKITLDVSSVKSDSLCRITMVIRDTGRGMTKEEIQKVYQNNGTHGIGLRVARHLLKLMDGNLEIESVPNEGTTVTISFNQEIVALKDDTKKERKLRTVSFQGKRILLVDDNKLNLKVTSKLLSPYHVEIVTVTSGQECLDILDKDTNFDLILMDDLMPNMSGSETLDILRKIERVSGYFIPVVVLTANATVGMKEQYLNRGFDDYLSKPINREELDRVLKEFLK